MKIERSVVANRRKTSEACAIISDFVAGIARERRYPDLAGIRAGFAKISPALGVMLVSRALADPAISVRMPDLQIEVSVSYSPDDDDNLTIPDMGLLDKLTASATIEVVLHATGTRHASLNDRLAEASAGGIKFSLAGGINPVQDAVPDTVPVNAWVPSPDVIPVPDPEIDPDPDLGAQGTGASAREGDFGDHVTDEPAALNDAGYQDEQDYLGQPAPYE